MWKVWTRWSVSFVTFCFVFICIKNFTSLQFHGFTSSRSKKNTRGQKRLHDKYTKITTGINLDSYSFLRKNNMWDRFDLTYYNIRCVLIRSRVNILAYADPLVLEAPTAQVITFLINEQPVAETNDGNYVNRMVLADDISCTKNIEWAKITFFKHFKSFYHNSRFVDKNLL